MTIEIAARGTTTKSNIRILIYADGREIGCCKKLFPVEGMIHRITLYSNVVDQDQSFEVREAIYHYFRRNGYRIHGDKTIRFCEKTWTKKIPHVSQRKKEG